MICELIPYLHLKQWNFIFSVRYKRNYKGKKVMFWTRDTDFLVIINHYDNDVSWSEKIKLPYVIYEKNQPDKEPFNAIKLSLKLIS